MALLDIITLFEAKRYLAMDQGDTTKDGELSTYITGISKALDGYSGPVVKRTIPDELHDGNRPFIMLREYPVDDVVTVTDYRGTTSTILTAETLGAPLVDEYQLNPANGILWRRAYGGDVAFSCGRSNIKVTYVAGRYDTTNQVAEEFKLAACLSLADAWRSTIGGGNVSYGSYEGDERARVTYAIPYQAQAFVPRRAPVVV